jgi:hypothetical protein
MRTFKADVVIETFDDTNHSAPIFKSRLGPMRRVVKVTAAGQFRINWMGSYTEASLQPDGTSERQYNVSVRSG